MNIATTSAASHKSPAQPFIDLEHISGELSVALTFTECADRFLGSIRTLGKSADAIECYVLPNIEHAQTMISELTTRLENAKAELDAFIDAVPADRLMVDRPVA